MKKDENRVRKEPATTTKSGMDKMENIEKGIKKEAGYPGGPENAAGKGKEYSNGNAQIGAKPISNDSLNLGNK